MHRPGIKHLLATRRAMAARLEAAWEVVRDGVVNYFRNGSLNQAAAIALYALLSIIPLFVLSMVAAGWFLGANLEIKVHILELAKEFHPYFSGDLLAQLGRLEDKSQLLGWIGIVSLIWFSSMIFGSLETALNIAFRCKGHRNFLVSKLLAFSMIPMGWVAGLTSVLLTYAATLVSSQVSVAGVPFLRLDLITQLVLRYAVPFLVSVLFTTVVFMVIPARRIRLRTALAGSCGFALLMELVKHAFTLYVAKYTRYNAIFGSLETVVILVIWVFYVALLLLLCAELMSSYERRDLLLVEHMLMDRVSRTVRQRLFRKFGRVCKEGTVICREGDLSREMFFVLSGRVRLEKRAGLAGNTLAVLETGAYFGEMAALSGVPRAATAVAATDCEVAVVDGEVLHRLLRDSDDLAILLLKEFAERIRRTNTTLDELSQAWTRALVLQRLLRAWPWAEGRDVVLEIAGATGKPPGEIRGVLEAAAADGVLRLAEGRIVAFEPDRAWDELLALSDRAGVPAGERAEP
ncbi:MAG TPA: YhjD/YihY/BrkB family envelope integrity protein [Holophaga sp.]|nr:YhjD/YihY/BrkB family envelope integrity protein [Holophaga sp.]